jgi:hypothetical protein
MLGEPEMMDEVASKHMPAESRKLPTHGSSMETEVKRHYQARWKHTSVGAEVPNAMAD